MTAVTTYVIAERSQGGEYWRGDRWTPASNEAKEYDDQSEAQQVIDGGMERDAVILTREYDTWEEAEAQKPSRELME